MLKQFEQEQWELFDAPAKEAATKFWIQLGYEYIENPNAKIKIIGLREGEKIHEQMIGVDDSLYTAEFKNKIKKM